MNSREEVYKAINDERQYQDHLSSDRTDKHTGSVGEELVLMHVYMEKALRAYTDNAGDAEAVNEVRKVAALGVRCMENCKWIPKRILMKEE